MLELDLPPDRSGLIFATQAARYKQLGDFIKSCYGAPANANHTEVTENYDGPGTYQLTFAYPTVIDRVALMENQTNGQVIRSYEVWGKVVDDGVTDGMGDGAWTKVANGTSIGHKKIDIFDEAVTVTEVRINTTFVDTPVWKSVNVYLCDRLVANETDWELSH